MARESSQERRSQPGPSRSQNLFRGSASPSDDAPAASTQPLPSKSKHHRTASSHSQAEEEGARRSRRQKRREEQAYQVKGWENLYGGGGSKPVFSHTSSKRREQADSSKNATSSTSSSSATLGKRKSASPSAQSGPSRSSTLASTQRQSTIDEESDDNFEVIAFKPAEKRTRLDVGVKASPPLNEPLLRRSSSHTPSIGKRVSPEKSKSPAPTNLDRPSTTSASSSRAPSLSRNPRSRSTSSNHAATELTPREVDLLTQSAMREFTNGSTLADHIRNVVQDYLGNIDATHPEQAAVEQLGTELAELGTKPTIGEIRTVTQSHSVPRRLAQTLAKVFRAWHSFLTRNHPSQQSTAATATASGSAVPEPPTIGPPPASLATTEAHEEDQIDEEVDELIDEPLEPPAESAEEEPADDEAAASSERVQASTTEIQTHPTSEHHQGRSTQEPSVASATDIAPQEEAEPGETVPSTAEKCDTAREADNAVPATSPDTTGSPQAFGTPPEEVDELSEEATDLAANTKSGAETGEHTISGEQATAGIPSSSPGDEGVEVHADDIEQVDRSAKANDGEQPEAVAADSNGDQSCADQQEQAQASDEPQSVDSVMESTETASHDQAQDTANLSLAATSQVLGTSVAESTPLISAPDTVDRPLMSDDLLIPEAGTDEEAARALTPGAEYSGFAEALPPEHDSPRPDQEQVVATAEMPDPTAATAHHTGSAGEEAPSAPNHGNAETSAQVTNEFSADDTVDGLMKAHTVESTDMNIVVASAPADDASAAARFDALIKAHTAPLAEASIATTHEETSSATADDGRINSAPTPSAVAETESGQDRASRAVSQAASDTTTTGKVKKTINDRMKVMLRDLAAVTGRKSSYSTIQKLKPLRAGQSTPRTVADLVENWQDPAKMIPWTCLQELSPEIFHKRARNYMSLSMNELVDRVSNTRSVQHLLKLPERVLTRAVMEFPRVPHMLHCWDGERQKYFQSRGLPEPKDTLPEFRFADQEPGTVEARATSSAQMTSAMPTSELATTQPRTEGRTQHQMSGSAALVPNQAAAQQQTFMDAGMQALASQILQNPQLFRAEQQLLQNIAAPNVPSVLQQQPQTVQLAIPQQRAVHPLHPALEAVQQLLHAHRQKLLLAEAEKTFSMFVSDPLSLAGDVLGKSSDIVDEVSQRGFSASDVMHVITFVINEHRKDCDKARSKGEVNSTAEAKLVKMSKVHTETMAVLRLTRVLKAVREALVQAARDEVRTGAKQAWEEVLVTGPKWEKDIRELLEGELAAWPVLSRAERETLAKRKVEQVSRALEEVLGRISEMGVGGGVGDDEVTLMARICCKHVVGELGDGRS